MRYKKIIKKSIIGLIFLVSSSNLNSFASCEYIANSKGWKSFSGGFWFKAIPSYREESTVQFVKCKLTSSKERYDPGGYNVLTGWMIQPHTDKWEYYSCGKHKLMFSKGYVSNIWSIADTSGSYHNINFPYKSSDRFNCSYQKYKDSYKTASFRGSKLILVERTNFKAVNFDF